MSLLMFQIVQIIYWIALSVWFGSVMFIALAAPVIFKTVQENNPVLTDILSVNLEGQHGTLLAGTIVANLIQRLLSVELICGTALLLMLIAQPFVIDLSRDPNNPLSNNIAAAVLRAVLFLGAAGIVIYDWRVLWPRIAKHRTRYIDHADEPEVANPAKDDFDREQRRSLTMLAVLAALLLGMILFSSNISPATSSTTQVVKSGQ
jgi:hypothetical protein